MVHQQRKRNRLVDHRRSPCLHPELSRKRDHCLFPEEGEDQAKNRIKIVHQPHQNYPYHPRDLLTPQRMAPPSLLMWSFPKGRMASTPAPGRDAVRSWPTPGTLSDTTRQSTWNSSPRLARFVTRSSATKLPATPI